MESWPADDSLMSTVGGVTMQAAHDRLVAVVTGGRARCWSLRRLWEEDERAGPLPAASTARRPPSQIPATPNTKLADEHHTGRIR
jgi:hypothetical protein